LYRRRIKDMVRRSKSQSLKEGEGAVMGVCECTVFHVRQGKVQKDQRDYLLVSHSKN
jgi:hypothetical protein